MSKSQRIYKKFLYKNTGFAALLSLLVISALALGISVSISLLGVGEVKSSLDFGRGQETLKIAESCVEEALIRLRNNDSYSGGSLNVGNGSCTISISEVGGVYTIDVEAEISGPPNYSKSVQVEAVGVGNSVNIISWTEV